MQTVEFERSLDPALVLWPPCTRVRRCGGCCASKLLHCVPTRTSVTLVKVIKARYPHPGAEMLELEGYESVRLEQHDRCVCQCRQEARDCNSRQSYQSAQCRCVCNNLQEAARCEQPDHFWDNKECICKCRHQSDCSTGSVFNRESCKCESLSHVPPLLERVPGPAPHLSVYLRDDGGENDAYRLRHAQLQSESHVGLFTLPHYKQEDRTSELNNETTTSQRTQN